MFLLKRVCLLASTDFTDSNNFAIVDASAIGHHGKEDGGGEKEEAEHPQHDPIQGMRKNLEKVLLETVENKNLEIKTLESCCK